MRPLLALVVFAVACSDTKPAKLTLTSPAGSVRDTEIRSLDAMVTNAGGTKVDGQTVAYLSSAPDIASVSNDGHYLCHKAGTAVLTATSGALVQSASVLCVLVSKVEAQKTAQLMVGDQPTSIKARALGADGADVMGAELQYTSSDPSVVQVDPTGTMTAASGGKAQITIQAGTAAAVVAVEVVDVGSIEVAKSYVFEVGTTMPYPARVLDHRGRALKVSPHLSSSDPSVVAIRGDSVQAASYGVATVTAKLGRTERAASVIVYESPPAKTFSVVDGGTFTINFSLPGSYDINLSAAAADGSAYGVSAHWQGAQCGGVPETRSGHLRCDLAGPAALVITNPTTFGLGPREDCSLWFTRWPMNYEEANAGSESLDGDI